MNPQLRTQFQTYFFFLFIGAALWTQFDLFFDLNLLPKLLLTNIFGLLFCLMLPSIQLNKIALYLGCFLIYNVLSVLWAMNADAVIQESQKVFLYLIAFIVGWETIKIKGLEFFLKTLVVALLITVLLNLGLYFLAHSNGSKFYSTSAHPNLLASIIILLLTFSFLYYLTFKLNKFWEAITITSIVLSVILLLVLFAKASLMAFIILLAGMFLVHKFNKYRKLVLLLLSAFTLSSLILPLLFPQLAHSFFGSSYDERLFIWDKTAQMIINQPVLGYGSGNWIYYYTMYGVEGFDTFQYYGLVMQRPHNDFLWILSELGVVGLLLILYPICLLLYQGFKKNEKKIDFVLIGIISFIPVLFYSFPKSRIEHIVLFFFLLALLYSFVHDLSKSEKNIRIKYPIIVILLASISLSISIMMSVRHTKNGIASIKSKDYENAIEQFKTAQTPLYKHTPEGYPVDSYIADCYQKMNDPENLLMYSYSAYQKAPYNYEIVTNLGVALNANHRFKEAKKVLLESFRINPKYDGTLLNLAIVNYNQKNFHEAKKWIDMVSFKSRLTDYYSGLIHQKLDQD